MCWMSGLECSEGGRGNRYCGGRSRIRRAHLSRFTIDRLMTVLNRLHQHVEVTVTVQPVVRRGEPLAAHP